MGAVEALALMVKGEILPFELLHAVVLRAEAVNRSINSFTYNYYVEAFATAKISEQRKL